MLVGVGSRGHQCVHDAVVLVGEGRRVFVAQTQAQREPWRDLPVVVKEVSHRRGAQQGIRKAQRSARQLGHPQQVIGEGRSGIAGRGWVLGDRAVERKLAAHEGISQFVEAVTANFPANSQGVFAACYRDSIDPLEVVVLIQERREIRGSKAAESADANGGDSVDVGKGRGHAENSPERSDYVQAIGIEVQVLIDKPAVAEAELINHSGREGTDIRKQHLFGVGLQLESLFGESGGRELQVRAIAVTAEPCRSGAFHKVHAHGEHIIVGPLVLGVLVVVGQPGAGDVRTGVIGHQL